jgi:hypothetical protein
MGRTSPTFQVPPGHRLELIGRETPPGAGPVMVKVCLEDDEHYLLAAAERASVVILAWGNDGAHLGRSKAVVELLQKGRRSLYHLGRNKGGKGEPKHPLYLSYETPLEKWTT